MPSDDLQARTVTLLDAYARGELSRDGRTILAHSLRTLAYRVDPSPTGQRRELLRLAIAGMTDAEIDRLVDVIARVRDVLVAGREMPR